jgi:hypothetical protein
VERGGAILLIRFHGLVQLAMRHRRRGVRQLLVLMPAALMLKLFAARRVLFDFSSKFSDLSSMGVP